MSAHNGVRAGGPSVADLLAFEALPEGVREIARRALGASGVPDVYIEALAKAYQAGFNACADDFEPPYCSDRESRRVAEAIAKGGL